ncbi:MAG: hypothetical protein EXR20_06095 [Bacteroidetes bacterium]|nr:hypothetical protein [Bacteroidota bacterium]
MKLFFNKNIIYLIFITLLILLFMAIRGCVNNRGEANYMFDKWLKDSTKLVVAKNELNQVSYISDVIKLNEAQIKLYAKSDSSLNVLTKRYSDIQAIIQTKGGVYVDTIWLFKEIHDTLPCADFEKKESVKNRYYSFDYLLTKKNMSITNLSFPDTIHTIIGDKKNGIFGFKRNLVVEQTHSNKFIYVQQLTPVIKTKKNNTPKWLLLGTLGGVITGYFIFNK